MSENRIAASSGKRASGCRVREAANLPVAAYSVSGEYAMIKAASQNGWLDERAAVLEALTGVKRAGADIIVTYHAPDLARWLSG